MKHALVVGGSGPSGPYMLQGLLDRGFEVTMFHTGRHEPDDLPPVHHVHGNPYEKDSIAETLGSTEYDVAIATYGRVRHIASHLAGKVGQFVSVSGTPIYKGFVTPDALDPVGLAIGVDERFELVPPEGIPGETYGSAAIRRTEDAVFGLGADGAFAATTFRYPSIYGPRNPHSWEWSAVRRVLDGRTSCCRTVVCLSTPGYQLGTRPTPYCSQSTSPRQRTVRLSTAPTTTSSL